jgi:hypothetical protein
MTTYENGHPRKRFQNSYPQILIYSIPGINRRVSIAARTYGATIYGLADRLLIPKSKESPDKMPQEVSVSYQAVKSKVYRLVDALVVGEKTEAEVQESIRRWWELIHPADRPIAQKYLSIILERSSLALDAVETGLMEANQSAARPPVAVKTLKIVERVVKQTTLSTSI